LPTIGEGLGEWFEAPSYEEGVGDDGGFWRRAFKMGLGYPQQGNALQKGFCSRSLQKMLKLSAELLIIQIFLLHLQS
jgi:hypothetical protein